MKNANAKKIAVVANNIADAPVTSETPMTPAVAAIVSNEASDTDTGDDVQTVKVTDHGGKRQNIFDINRSKVSSEASAKVQLLSSTTQRLAEAADMFKEGEGKASEAQSIAYEAAGSLYQGQTAGLLSKEEVSSALGNVFGFKPGRDGKPGKTPAGNGENIRKRIVRAVDAYNYLHNQEDSRFFEGLTEDSDDGSDNPTTLAELLYQIGEGQVSLSTAYNKFAEIKRNHATRTEVVFDVKKVAAMANKLGEDMAQTVAIFLDNPGLVEAWGALRDVLNSIGEAAANDEQKAA